MAQNMSSAVMQQRSEPHDSLDDFPTPPWAGRALCELLEGKGFCLSGCTVWEPAVNRGYLESALREYFADVARSDVHEYGFKPLLLHDFLQPFKPFDEPVDWVITNPPFRLAEQFIERANQVAKFGFAMLVRTSFLEGVGRYERLFSANPPSIVAQFVERVPMVKGRYDPKASTATSYAWLIWFVRGQSLQRCAFEWIPPCKRQLERADDVDLCT